VTDYDVLDGTFVPGKPRVWTALPRVGNTGFSRMDVAADGKRNAILTRPPDAGGQMPRMNLLLNFFGEVRRASQ
jgi:hypothetical protein